MSIKSSFTSKTAAYILKKVTEGSGDVKCKDGGGGSKVVMTCFNEDEVRLVCRAFLFMRPNKTVNVIYCRRPFFGSYFI